MTTVHLYDLPDRVVELGPGLAAVHLLTPPNPGHHGWGIRHACPGTYREQGDDTVYVVAPFIASDLLSEAPLTFAPSVLCKGAGNRCDLHGFITNGVWVDAGTPELTIAFIRSAVFDPAEHNPT